MQKPDELYTVLVNFPRQVTPIQSCATFAASHLFDALR
jgi:hypothetical protein